MEAAEKVLVSGGLFLLTFAFAMGFMLSRARALAEIGPKYLILAHMEPLQQGTLMLALVWAVRMSTLPDGLEVVAASLMVTAAFLQGGKELLNHTQGIRDEFAERPIGWWIARTQAILSSTGLIIFVIGCVSSLF